MKTPVEWEAGSQHITESDGMPCKTWDSKGDRAIGMLCLHSYYLPSRNGLHWGKKAIPGQQKNDLIKCNMLLFRKEKLWGSGREDALCDEH